MKSKEQSGFALAMVIIIIALIGAVTFVLAEGARTLQFHSDTAYLRAIERNLTTSALAWARNNTKVGNTNLLGKVVKLDVPVHIGIRTRQSSANVVVISSQDETLQVRVDTFCSKGRRSLQSTIEYKL